MAEAVQRATSRPGFESLGCFQCFGFGYNGFTQLAAQKSVSEDAQLKTLDLSGSPVLTPLALNVGCVNSIVASWSTTFYLKGIFPRSPDRYLR